MSTFSAAHTLLNALAQSGSSEAADAPSQSALTDIANSEPTTNTNNNHNTPRILRGTRRVRWRQEAEERVPEHHDDPRVVWLRSALENSQKPNLRPSGGQLRNANQLPNHHNHFLRSQLLAGKHF